MSGESVRAAGAGQPAPVGRRLLAALYDLPMLITLLLIGTGLLLLLNRGAQLGATALSVSIHRVCLVALWAGYNGVCWTRYGQTLGMRVWRIRLTRLDGTHLRWSDAVLRLAMSVIAWLPFALGVIAAAWDAEARTWHDRWSRTRVSCLPVARTSRLTRHPRV